MVGTQSNPRCKLEKDFLQSCAHGNIKRHKKAKHSAPSSSSLPSTDPSPSSSEPVRVAGRLLPRTPPKTHVINITGCPIGKPITRQDTPTCLDYGCFRRAMYPGSFFCTHCNDWEEKIHLKCHLSNETRGKKSACKCEHTSFVEPSTWGAFTENVPLLLSNKTTTTPHPLPTKYKSCNPQALLKGSDDNESESLGNADDPSWFFDDKAKQMQHHSDESRSSDSNEDCKLPAIATIPSTHHYSTWQSNRCNICV